MGEIRRGERIAAGGAFGGKSVMLRGELEMPRRRFVTIVLDAHRDLRQCNV
jgi:hypothetical protein